LSGAVIATIPEHSSISYFAFTERDRVKTNAGLPLFRSGDKWISRFSQNPLVEKKVRTQTTINDEINLRIVAIVDQSGFNKKSPQGH
jgi:hypothetical protein